MSGRVPIHGFAVGANKDLLLLGVLAEATGGMALIDNSELKATEVGKTLAEAIDRPVLYPTSLSVHWSGAEVLPQQPLPLRSDRETIYIARGQWEAGASLSVQTSEGELSWNVPDAKYQQGNQTLAGSGSRRNRPRAGCPVRWGCFPECLTAGVRQRCERLEITVDRPCLVATWFRPRWPCSSSVSWTLPT